MSNNTVYKKRSLYCLILISLGISCAAFAIYDRHADQGPSRPFGILNASLSYSGQWGSYGGPVMPQGIALDASGNLFIADAKNFGVLELTGNGSFIRSWGAYGSGPGKFVSPQGIALDASGNVYVSDSQNNNVQKFTNTGGFITSWSTWNNTKVLDHPFGISVNSTGFVYVVDQGDKLVQVYRNNGTYVKSFGGPGTAPGKFTTPFGIALGSSSVFVSDNSLQSGNITEFTSTGGLVCQWGSSSLGEPAMLTIDSSSNIYAVDNFYGQVVKFSACNNKPLWSSGQIGSGPGQFNGPVGIAADNQMNLFIGDSQNLRIQKLSATSGGYLSSFTYPRTGLLSGPFDAAVDSSGHIYVADNGNNRIQEFSLSGSFVRSFGLAEQLGALFDPQGVAVDRAGNVYASDYSNSRVEKFYANGTYIRDLGKGSTQFVNPYGIATDASNNVYVTDYSNNTIEKFDSSGNFVTAWASRTGNCLFNNPTGIVLDSTGNNIYVSDSGNNRIEKCSSSGLFIQAWGSSGSGNGQFSFPSHLSLDSGGRLYVADTFNNRIQEFASNGTFLATFGIAGSGNGQLSDPRGLAIDGSGNVYVTDTGSGSGTSNNRIEVFNPQTGTVGGAVMPIDLWSLLEKYIVSTIIIGAALIFSIAVFRRVRRRSQTNFKSHFALTLAG